jgi:hypothetical protein
LPEWVEQWNAAVPRAEYPEQWALLREPKSYLGLVPDDRPFERPPPKLGTTFPHPLGRVDDPGYFDLFMHTPYLDTLTLQFVRKLVATEGLGSRPSTDLLAISLSATDYVGHSFGPESLEAEDNLARLDRELAAFIAYLDERVGRDRYLLVLTADHGLAATPEYAATLGLAARRLDAKQLADVAEREIATRLEVSGPIVSAFIPPDLYLDHAKLAAADGGVDKAAGIAAAVLRKLAGIAHVYTRDDLSSEPPLGELVRNSFFEPRSGDVYVVAEPGSAIVDGLGLYTAYHGSPYAADRYVPLCFFGAGLSPQRIDRLVSTRSLAPTLALVLGIPPPSYATAGALVELTAQRGSTERRRR